MIAYHGTAKSSSTKLEMGTYLTCDKLLAKWYADNSASEFGGCAKLASTKLTGEGLLLDTDVLEWIGYEEESLKSYLDQGYSFIHNESFTEIVILATFDCKMEDQQ